MLKATAGGGGMGLLTCQSEKEVRGSFKTVQSRGETLFKNSGLFIEKFYPSSHHIEVQVFGNGHGKAIHFGERECSIQRRHQKVIEECPSPFVTKHPELREKLGSAAVRLAEAIKYGSAGTVEFLVDDETADFFFPRDEYQIAGRARYHGDVLRSRHCGADARASRCTTAGQRWP